MDNRVEAEGVGRDREQQQRKNWNNCNSKTIKKKNYYKLQAQFKDSKHV